MGAAEARRTIFPQTANGEVRRAPRPRVRLRRRTRFPSVHASFEFSHSRGQQATARSQRTSVPVRNPTCPTGVRSAGRRNYRGMSAVRAEATIFSGEGRAGGALELGPRTHRVISARARTRGPAQPHQPGPRGSTSATSVPRGCEREGFASKVARLTWIVAGARGGGEGSVTGKARLRTQPTDAVRAAAGPICLDPLRRNLRPLVHG